MGREIKRVALTFDWPMDKRWEGYLNPHYKKCPQDGITCWNGNNAAAVYLEHLTNMFGVVADSAMTGRTHPYLLELPYGSNHPRWEMQSEEARVQAVEFWSKLAETKADGFMGACGQGFRLYFRLLEIAGIRTDADGTDEEKGYEWGRCPMCNGSGIDPAVEEAYEAWERIEPPEGEGWQVWENVSEGSPITPVFATRESLVDYLVEGGDGWDRKRGSGGWTRENAEAFVGHGYAPSLISVDGKFYEPRDGVPS